jgi:hypothetical protein
MPIMLRKKGKATNIAYALLGTKKKKKRVSIKEQRLLSEETAKVRY